MAQSKSYQSSQQLLCLSDVEKLAKQTLRKETVEYFSSGADEEVTLRNNIQAFQRIQIRPRLLRGISKVNLSTTVLGNEISMPICVSPTAVQKLAHPDGEGATSKACARAQTVMGISFYTSSPNEHIVNASPGTICWQHLILLKDKEQFKRIILQGEQAGVKGFIITADEPVRGKRRLYTGAASFRQFTESLGISFPMLDGITIQSGDEELHIDRNATWDVISWVKSITKLPVIIKGILTAEDAKLAVHHGADAIIVSNHGGRQLDGVLATIDALPEVISAVNGQVEVYLDGGVRLGTDVLKALAMGARAVFIGRPVIYGLAYQGEEGVYKVLEMLREELRRAMFLSGCASVTDVPPSLVTRQYQCHL